MDETEPEFKFRAAKRRKVVRKRPDDDDDEPIISNAMPKACTADELVDQASHQEDESTKQSDSVPQMSLAQIRQLQKGAKARKKGFNFSEPTASLPVEARNELQVAETETQKHSILESRFAPQVGMEKHMKDASDHALEKFIDEKMAEKYPERYLRQEPAKATPSEPQGNLSHRPLYTRPPCADEPEEISLYDEISMDDTEQMKAGKGGSKAQGNSSERSKGDNSKDGKPRKKWNRRNSADLQRDSLVDEVLRENRLERFEELEAPSGPENGQSADDYIAEQFIRQYEQEQAFKELRKQPGKPDPQQKGPKLGGSRSARALVSAKEKEATGKKRW
ncbi:MAG: hypothetical protein M1820_010495 [Bogoriella megaspora]|nr:MAG: hypothetical protein M1820_010495 [Bogoriella megaspora]